MAKRIHHLGIGVKDLERILQFYRDTLGLELTERIEWPGLKAALLPIGGVILELIEPSEVKIPVAASLMQVVEEHGGGIHHVCIEVDDIEAEMASLKEKGVQFMSEKPQETPGGRILWLEEVTVDGFMIELCEKGYRIM